MEQQKTVLKTYYTLRQHPPQQIKNFTKLPNGLNQQIIVISYYQILQDAKWSYILQFIDQAYWVQLIFGYLHYPKILKQIQNIKFVELIELDLQQNQITNIQSLTCIEFRKLQTLNLRNNNITKIDCFGKLNLPFISKLNISVNPINTMTKTTRALFNTQKIQYFILGYFSLTQNKIEDLTSIIKLNCVLLERLFTSYNGQDVQDMKRIIQAKIQRMLSQRYQYIGLINNV